MMPGDDAARTAAEEDVTAPAARNDGKGPASVTADWIAVDWGTTRLRAWAMTADGSAIARAASDDGMGRLTREGYEPALLALAGAWLEPDRRTPVVVCGMAGSRQGWAEAKYRVVPCAPLDGKDITVVPAADPRLDVHIVPGLSQPAPPDVMRGEETQIAGFLARSPGFSGVACLPGTHTKWARIRDGEVTEFRTFMTGELFSLLSGKSVLSPLMSGEGWSDAAFDAALGPALAAPEATAAALFSLRAEALLNGLPPEDARARLSAILIGAELAAARRYWQEGSVAVIGADAVANVYAAALASQGGAVESVGGDTASIAGLAIARSFLGEVT